MAAQVALRRKQDETTLLNLESINTSKAERGDCSLSLEMKNNTCYKPKLKKNQGKPANTYELVF